MDRDFVARKFWIASAETWLNIGLSAISLGDLKAIPYYLEGYDKALMEAFK
jgi:hypothetical protein